MALVANWQIRIISMGIVIRKATEEDIPAIFALIQELAQFENGLENVRNSVAQMKAEKDYFNCYVADKSGEVVGMALYFFAYFTWVGKTLYLDDLYVKQAYRGQNIGSRLMAKMKEVACEESCKRLRLQVLHWNANAIAFYEKAGFYIDKDWYNCDISLG